MKPYTYLIKHRPSGKVYYGFRCANKVEPLDDLWKHYFTSSPGVQKLIEETGVDSFDTEIRRVFETKEQAVAWETRVLHRCKVLHDDRWLNQNVAGYIVPTKESNKKISNFHKDKHKSEEHKQKIRQRNLGKNKGKIATDEHRRKNSEAHRGEKNAMYGKSHSEETKAKISKLMSERIKGDNNPMRKVEWTKERREHMRQIRSQRAPWTDEQKKAVAEKLRGQTRPKLYCAHCDRHIAQGWFHRHGANCASLKL
jgi:hypothetical protein